jgi:tetratricopeptide (TPR) repeat protein
VSLFRRKQAERPPEDDGATESFDEIITPFYETGDWEGLIRTLERIDPQELDEQDAIAWHTGRGTAPEQLGRRDEAVSAYIEGARLHPDSSVLQTVAGRVLEEDGRFDEALQHFRRVRLAEGGGSAVMTAARYCYLWDALDDAIALHAQIFDAFFSLRIVDDTFLYIRRLPFFSRAFAAQAAVLVLSGRANDASELLRRCEAELDELGGSEEEGRLTLEATLGQPAGLLEYLSRVGEGNDVFAGYARMALATWRARAAGQPAEADRLLQSVTLRENDFPWLEDVRLLASIAAERRAGEVQRDDPRVVKLFGRQGMLLEPEHAFNFGLLDEQEILKERYRDERRRVGPPVHY